MWWGEDKIWGYGEGPWICRTSHEPSASIMCLLSMSGFRCGIMKGENTIS